MTSKELREEIYKQFPSNEEGNYEVSCDQYHLDEFIDDLTKDSWVIDTTETTRWPDQVPAFTQFQLPSLGVIKFFINNERKYTIKNAS
jgi:hypothetical protein